MLVKTYGSALFGINAITVTVEVNISTGVNYFIVGLPDSAVKESQQRIDAALKNTGYKIPGKKIIVNMAPADIRKQGASYDMTIAIGILAANKNIQAEQLHQYIIIGELSLDGSIQPIRGVLSIALQAKADGFKGIFLPYQNAQEAAVVEGLHVYGVKSIKQVIDFFNQTAAMQPTVVSMQAEFEKAINQNSEADFSEVKGQENIKRALEIAATGGHNALLIGPPGSGKTMLARRLPSILPPLTLEEALETTKIHSVAGKLRKNNGIITNRPFRSPHHTISDIALIGGGANPQPGEISLAHNGILFLDELPEFRRSVLEVLRQPLEDRFITLSRAKITLEYPSSFMLIASMNPCPCGNHNNPDKECTCDPRTVHNYLSRLSGPLLDRIDLHVEVTPMKYKELSSDRKVENSDAVRKRVMAGRAIQNNRYNKHTGIHCNAQMTSTLVRQYCTLNPSSKQLLQTAIERLGLSARAYDRILKVARTIADLDHNDEIQTNHIAEAIQYRSLDRSTWSGY